MKIKVCFFLLLACLMAIPGITFAEVGGVTNEDGTAAVTDPQVEATPEYQPQYQTQQEEAIPRNDPQPEPDAQVEIPVPPFQGIQPF